MMREYTPAELIDITPKCQQKVRESIQASLAWLWDTRGNGSSLTRQKAEKMRNITTHPALQQHWPGAWGSVGRVKALTPLKVGLF